MPTASATSPMMPPEGVNFANQMAFGNAADGRIAAHLGDEVEVHGNERGPEAHTRGGHGGFASGVTGAHNDDVVLFGERHPALLYGLNGAVAAASR